MGMRGWAVVEVPAQWMRLCRQARRFLRAYCHHCGSHSVYPPGVCASSCGGAGADRDGVPREQVGVPRSVAATLTVPERVTRHNRERLRCVCVCVWGGGGQCATCRDIACVRVFVRSALVARGWNHPGAKWIVRADGMRIDLRYAKVCGWHIVPRAPW